MQLSSILSAIAIAALAGRVAADAAYVQTYHDADCTDEFELVEINGDTCATWGIWYSSAKITACTNTLGNDIINFYEPNSCIGVSYSIPCSSTGSCVSFPGLQDEVAGAIGYQVNL